MSDRIVVNISAEDLALRREDFVSQILGSIDAKRPTAWTQYGYPERVQFAQLKQAYDRSGAGYGAVHRLLGKCWQEKPRIKKKQKQEAGAEPATNAAAPKVPKPAIAPKKPKQAGKVQRKRGNDEPTPWELKIDTLMQSIKGWQKLRDFDRRNMIGRYAALIYRVADGKALDQPLTSATKLVDIVPLYEEQIKVTAWNTDPVDADNFGTPKMFQYHMRLEMMGDVQAQPDKWVDVHPTRVQILAEGSVGNMFEGVPLLLAGFNNLIELEKIAGGSAEGFLKNSSRTLSIEFAPESSPQVLTQNPDGSQSGQTVGEFMEAKLKKLNRNIDASVVLQGGEAKTLQTTLVQPQESFEVAANLFAASVRIPYTILFGQQTGRLASDEDQNDMNARCEERQDSELTPAIEEFVKRMQACGVIEAGEFEVEWPPLDAPGDTEKLDQGAKMATINKEGQAGGLTEPVFDANEIRQVAGYDPREDDGMPDEGELAAEQEAQRQHELALRATGPAAPPGGARPRMAAV